METMGYYENLNVTSHLQSVRGRVELALGWVGEITFKFRLRDLEGRVPQAEEIAWRVSLTGSSQVALVVKKLPASVGHRRGRVWSLGWEDPLEEGLATHCSVLAWRIPWAEKPGGLQFMGLQKNQSRLKQLSTQACTFIREECDVCEKLNFTNLDRVQRGQGCGQNSQVWPALKSSLLY